MHMRIIFILAASITTSFVNSALPSPLETKITRTYDEQLIITFPYLAKNYSLIVSAKNNNADYELATEHHEQILLPLHINVTITDRSVTVTFAKKGHRGFSRVIFPASKITLFATPPPKKRKTY